MLKPTKKRSLPGRPAVSAVEGRHTKAPAFRSTSPADMPRSPGLAGPTRSRFREIVLSRSETFGSVPENVITSGSSTKQRLSY